MSKELKALIDEIIKDGVGNTIQIPDDDDALVDERQIAAWGGFSLSRLRNDRYQKKGIPFIKFGSSVKYRVGDYRSHIQNNRVETEV